MEKHPLKARSSGSETYPVCVGCCRNENETSPRLPSQAVFRLTVPHELISFWMRCWPKGSLPVMLSLWQFVLVLVASRRRVHMSGRARCAQPLITRKDTEVLRVCDEQLPAIPLDGQRTAQTTSCLRRTRPNRSSQSCRSGRRRRGRTARAEPWTGSRRVHRRAQRSWTGCVCCLSSTESQAPWSAGYHRSP